MFFFLFCPQRRCHRKRKPNSRTWPNKTRFAMRGKWRITFPQRARRWSDLRTLTPPRGHRMFHNLPIVLVHFNSLFLKKCSIKNWHVFFFFVPQVCVLSVLCRLPSQGEGRESSSLYWGHCKEVRRDVEQHICRGKAAIWKEGCQVEGEIWQGGYSSFLSALTHLFLLR